MSVMKDFPLSCRILYIDKLGGVYMTVLFAIAARPLDNLKPYFLMGTDSLRIDGRPIFSEDGRMVDFQIISKDEDSQKIFKVRDKLVGMTGRFNIDITDGLIRYLNEKDRDNEELSRLALSYIEEVIENDQTGLEYQRCTVTIGSCKDSIPTVSYLEYDTRESKKSLIETIEVKPGSFYPIFAGNKLKSSDLIEKTLKRISNSNLNLVVVKRATMDYLKEAATRYPDTCNQNIKIEVLR